VTLRVRAPRRPRLSHCLGADLVTASATSHQLEISGCTVLTCSQHTALTSSQQQYRILPGLAHSWLLAGQAASLHLTKQKESTA